MSISPPRVLEGRALGGRYRVLGPLGDPAENLFSVRDANGVTLTLKLFETQDEPQVLAERLRTDSVVSARPEHPNLLPVLDIGVEAELERAYVALPALRGKDVRRSVAEQGPLEPAIAVRITLAACEAIAALHACGIVPRAIRPGDFRLEPAQGDELTVRMLALEPAALENSDEQLSGSEVVPARSFVSPEQLERLNGADARSNVWSLGACLYFMLSGSSPGADTTGGEVHNVQELAPWVEPGLAVALHLALRADPQKRWPTPQAFAKALIPYAPDEARVASGHLPLTAETREKKAAPADLKSLSAPKIDPASSVTATSNSSTGLFRKLEHEPGGLSALVGHRLSGRFEVLRPIGKGGMGAVFEVRGPDGQLAAAKLIDRRQVGESQETYRRFVREAKSASSLTSDHVVRIIEAGIDEELNAPFILMELLHGVDLKSVIRQKGALKQQPVVRLFAQAAKGIVAAHKQRIVHRDIKPANLFLDEQTDGRVVVKVCDFGIAKRTLDADEEATATGDLTRTGGMLGSPLYMSPEQATNARNVDHRTDIWSLCISLYEALSGSKPFGGRAALGEIIVAICTQPVTPLRRVAPWVDRGLAEVVHRGLKAELGERWSNMEELVAALEPYTGGSDELCMADLEGVSPDQKSIQPSSIPPPSADHEAATIIGGIVGKTGAKAEPIARPGKLRGVMLGAGITVVAIAAVIALRYTAPARPIPEPTPEPGPSPTAMTPVTTEARVTIVPPQAEVTIDGRPAEVADGMVTIKGTPGTSFEIVLTLPSGTKKVANVVLSREGVASPDSLEVRDEVPEKPVAKAVGGKRPQLAKPAPSGAPADTAKPPAEPTAKPTTDPTQKPDFKTDW